MPADLGEVVQRLSKLSDANTEDIDLALSLCSFRIRIGSDTAVAACERALGQQPDLPVALQLEATALSRQGDLGGARAALRRCVEILPTASDCWRSLAWLDAHDGNCQASERETRTLIAVDPSNATAYVLLPNLIAAQRKGEAAVELAAERNASLIGHEDWTQPYVRAMTLMWRGELIDADAQWLAAERALASDPDLLPADEPQARMTLWLEAGESARAIAIARDFVRAAAGVANSFADDPRIDAWCIMHRAGALSTVEWEEKVRLWGQSNRYDSGLGHRAFQRWLRADVCGVSTRDEARQVIRRNPSPNEVERARLTAEIPIAEQLGRLFWIAGDLDRAIPLLASAAHSCFGYSHVLEQMHAHHELALALAERGDVEGACASEQVVVERWGNARPRSVTANAARDHMRALGCRASRAGRP
jgi:serine/threonine-protein kinase